MMCYTKAAIASIATATALGAHLLHPYLPVDVGVMEGIFCVFVLLALVLMVCSVSEMMDSSPKQLPTNQ